MKLLKTVRFDPSDARVFPLAAEPGEWCVPGGFLFARATELTGKAHQAFANGLLGLASGGHATFAQVVSVEDAGEMRAALTGFLVRWGAPSEAAATEAAGQELAFVAELCEDAPIGAVFAVSRALVDGEVRESFRLIDPDAPRLHARVWEIVE